jgi:methylated-DNA-protein-cysteine methyltransferase related protein
LTQPDSKGERWLRRDVLRPNGQRDAAFRAMILSIPKGKVSTYGAVAAAAGYPRYHRAVARLLQSDPPDRLPWHRVVGSGGAIKLHAVAAQEQRLRLQMEGVQFRGKRVNMQECEYLLRPWEVDR